MLICREQVIGVWLLTGRLFFINWEYYAVERVFNKKLRATVGHPLVRTYFKSGPL